MEEEKRRMEEIKVVRSHTSFIYVIVTHWKPIFLIEFTEFENRSTINLLHVYFKFEFQINLFNCSNPLIYSKQSIPCFSLHGLESESYFPTFMQIMRKSIYATNLLTVRHQQGFQPIQNRDPPK